jgi:hypothetical protein
MKYILDKDGNIVDKNKKIDIKVLKDNLKLFSVNKTNYLSNTFSLFETSQDIEKGKYKIVNGKPVVNEHYLTKEQYETKIKQLKIEEELKKEELKKQK